MAAATGAQMGSGEELPHMHIKSGSREELSYFQGKEQRLYFAGAVLKRSPTSKVRETQEGRH